MKKSIIKALSLVLLLALAVSFVGCGAKTLTGKYTYSTDNSKVVVDFKKDGTFTWTQTNTVIGSISTSFDMEGTYEYNSDNSCFDLKITVGSGILSANAKLTATLKGKTLTVNGSGYKDAEFKK